MQILEKLEAEGYSEVVLAGGALVNPLFAEAGLIDEIMVAISPTIFGNGISLFTPEISIDLGSAGSHPAGQEPRSANLQGHLKSSLLEGTMETRSIFKALFRIFGMAFFP